MAHSARRARRPKRVLVVCHANQWRSPLAAAALASCGGIEVRSAGFRRRGRSAARRARLAAALLGYDLDAHKSSVVDGEVLAWAHLIVYMDSGNRRRLVDAMRLHKVARPYACLGAWCHPPRRRIADPAFVRDLRAFIALMCAIDSAAKELGRSVRVGRLVSSLWERL